MSKRDNFTELLKIRVTRAQLRRVFELMDETDCGNTSEVVRLLIDNSRVEPRPMPVAILPVAQAESEVKQ